MEIFKKIGLSDKQKEHIETVVREDPMVSRIAAIVNAQTIPEVGSQIQAALRMIASPEENIKAEEELGTIKTSGAFDTFVEANRLAAPTLTYQMKIVLGNPDLHAPDSLGRQMGQPTRKFTRLRGIQD